jgi:hypothetical protein
VRYPMKASWMQKEGGMNGRRIGPALILVSSILLALAGCTTVPGSTDPSGSPVGTWLVTAAPSGWVDAKYVISANAVDIYWNTGTEVILGVTANTNIARSFGGRGMISGTIATVNTSLGTPPKVGTALRMIYARNWDALTLDYATDAGAKVPGTTIQFTLAP